LVMRNGIRIAVTALSLSAVGLIGVAKYERYRGTAYRDAVGVPTIGYGTTRGVKIGDTTTPERALIRLGQDVGQFERAMRVCIGDVPLSQNEWDAYVSLAYNIGHRGFCKSTIVRRLKQNPADYAGACEAILMWDKAGGRVLAGLASRRQKEYRQCMGVTQ
jgi:lysozyme